MMAVASWSTFLIFYHMLIFHSAEALDQSQESCPMEFPCGIIGNVSFPFTISSQPDCGLYTIDCDATPNPKLHLGENVYSALDQRLSDNSFRVLDLRLNDLLANKSCQSFDSNISFPSSPSISFRTLEPNLTLFRCVDITSGSTNYTSYFRDYQNFTNCRGFSIYYKYPSRKADVYSYVPEGDIPDNCSRLQFQIQWRSLLNTQNRILFDFLTAEFRFVWSLSDDCTESYYQGGRCSLDSNNTFRCSSNLYPRGKQGKLILVVAPVAAFSCIGILIFLFYNRKKIWWSNCFSFWESKEEDHQNIEAFLKSYTSFAPKRYSYSEVLKITSCFRNKLGQGGFGYVYKGSLHDGSHMAVKILKKLEGSGEEFINEVASISRTSHVNIVSLVGFCFEGRKRALIYEFMTNGSLEKFIYDRKTIKDFQLGWPTLYKVAIGIARGLEYLHRGCNTRILHFDIKPHNILLDEDFCPKISDFGLSKLCNKKDSIVSMLGARGTIGYIAPEMVCRNFGGVSHKSDVYSYGMMVLEMVGGRKNVDVEVDHTSEIYFPHWIYTRLQLDEDLRLTGMLNEEEKECARKMVIVSLWCIQTDPSNRPPISRVLEMLEGNLDSLQIPPRPYLYSPSTSDVGSSVVELA